jgi:hypothetical protein
LLVGLPGSFCAKVHQLVLEAFIGPRPPGHESAHLNGIKADNRSDNLVWATAAVNTAHKVLHGTIPRGSAQYHAKLTEADVSRLREAALFGANRYVLSAIYGLSRGSIDDAISGRTWRHV